MAVDALQLRPRSTLALFDAALRAAAASSGVWVLVMPASAALIFSCFNAADSLQRGREFFWPVVGLTVAWMLRCFSQGAASHFLEQQILAIEPPAVADSVRAALNRFPALIVAGTIQLVVDVCLLCFTFGIGFFFVGAHLAIFPAAMRGEGAAVSLYGTTSKLLGGARHTAPFVRFLNAVQIVLAFNLHLAVAFASVIGEHVLALDLNFVDRFASFDNGVWVATVCVWTFAFFEPVRVATGVLLLIDGRVRQEGLDLIAQVEQLPRRKKPRAPSVAALSLLVVALPSFAQPAEEPTALRQRVERLVEECEMGPRVKPEQIRQVDEVSERDKSALSRFVSRVERRAYDDEDCDAAEGDLREGLKELSAAQALESPSAAARARTDAQTILAGPEFQSVDTEKKAEEPKDDDSSGWLSEKIGAWLRDFFEWLFKRRVEAPDTKPVTPAGGEMVGANAVMIVIVIGLVALLVFLLMQLLPKRAAPSSEGELLTALETKLESDPMSALSKRPETWAGLADELAAKGEYREAIRHLYLALLSNLHRAGAIDYNPTKSNWDYLFAFRGPGEHKSAFRELTRRFDFTWYGKLDVTAAAYASFRSTVQPLLVPAEPAANA